MRRGANSNSPPPLLPNACVSQLDHVPVRMKLPRECRARHGAGPANETHWHGPLAIGRTGRVIRWRRLGEGVRAERSISTPFLGGATIPRWSAGVAGVGGAGGQRPGADPGRRCRPRRRRRHRPLLRGRRGRRDRGGREHAQPVRWRAPGPGGGCTYTFTSPFGQGSATTKIKTAITVIGDQATLVRLVRQPTFRFFEVAFGR